MKIFCILSLLAMATTITTATIQFEPTGQDLERPQQPFSQEQPLPQQQPFPQQPFSLQKPLPQQQQPYPEQDPQQPLPQQQPPFQQHPQQSFPQQEQPFPQQPPQQQYPQQPPQQQYPQQQPLTQQQPIPQQPQFPQQPQPTFPQQQTFPQHQQPLTEQPYPQQQPLPQQPSVEEKQQLNVCKEFLLQQCNPEEKVSPLQLVVPFLRPKISQQSSCQLKQQQCCQQLAHVNKQSRCPAIQSIVHAIIIQQQQQVGQGFSQPQPQQMVQGMSIPPQQFKLIGSLVMQTLPKICNVDVPPYCSTMTAPFGSMIAGIDGQ